MWPLAPITFRTMAASRSTSTKATRSKASAPAKKAPSASKAPVKKAAAKPPAKKVAAKKAPVKAVAKKATPAARVERDADSRQRIIDSAIACILEQGFYRASSNAIAERAGLTWGVIQYYFGTRERLMSAVLEEGSKRLHERLQAAHITAATLEARIEEYFDVLAGYYGSPEHLVFTQVLINLSHDPRTSEQTRTVMSETSVESSPELRRLVNEVLAGTNTRNTALRALLFHALRGLSLSHALLDTVNEVVGGESGNQFPAQRRLLSHALTLLIEDDRKK
jgi:AcrR family transcriptional regulator